jgi:hypothetical protein
MSRSRSSSRGGRIEVRFDAAAGTSVVGGAASR